MADLANQVERSLKTLSKNKASFLKFAEKSGPRPNGQVVRIKTISSRSQLQSRNEIMMDELQNMRDCAEWIETRKLSDERVLESCPT